MEEKRRLSRVEINHQREKKKRVSRWIKYIIGIIFLFACIYVTAVYLKTKNAFDKTYDPQNSVTQAGFSSKKKFAVLLLGTDTGALGRHEKRGNTDTIIVATVNPNDKKVSLMSIPRDTMAEMIGSPRFSVHKINAAYNMGGPKMAMETVSKLLNVPLKYYITINMGGMTKLVDGVGGVDVVPPLTFTYDGCSFTKGVKTHLDGKKALAYARMRYDDPQGDYGRQLRQRQVIMSILKHSISFDTVKNLDEVLNTASNSIKTNIRFDSFISIFKNYRDCSNNMSNDYLHGNGAMIGDASYQVMSNKELNRVSKILREQLGLEYVELDNNETYQNSRNKQFDWLSGNQNQPYYIYEPNSNKLWHG